MIYEGNCPDKCDAVILKINFCAMISSSAGGLLMNGDWCLGRIQQMISINPNFSLTDSKLVVRWKLLELLWVMILKQDVAVMWSMQVTPTDINQVLVELLFLRQSVL